jgi:hypothetical protein
VKKEKGKGKRERGKVKGERGKRKEKTFSLFTINL